MCRCKGDGDEVPSRKASVVASAATRHDSPTKLRMEPPRHAAWPRYHVLEFDPSKRRVSSNARPPRVAEGSDSQAAAGLRKATCSGGVGRSTTLVVDGWSSELVEGGGNPLATRTAGCCSIGSFGSGTGTPSALCSCGGGGLAMRVGREGSASVSTARWSCEVAGGRGRLGWPYQCTPSSARTATAPSRRRARIARAFRSRASPLLGRNDSRAGGHR